MRSVFQMIWTDCSQINGDFPIEVIPNTWDLTSTHFELGIVSLQKKTDDRTTEFVVNGHKKKVVVKQDLTTLQRYAAAYPAKSTSTYPPRMYSYYRSKRSILGTSAMKIGRCTYQFIAIRGISSQLYLFGRYLESRYSHIAIRNHCLTKEHPFTQIAVGLKTH